MQETTIKRNNRNDIKNKTLWLVFQPILCKHIRCQKKIQRTSVIRVQVLFVIKVSMPKQSLHLNTQAVITTYSSDVAHLRSPWNTFPSSSGFSLCSHSLQRRQSCSPGSRCEPQKVLNPVRSHQESQPCCLTLSSDVSFLDTLIIFMAFFGTLPPNQRIKWFQSWKRHYQGHLAFYRRENRSKEAARHADVSHMITGAGCHYFLLW